MRPGLEPATFRQRGKRAGIWKKYYWNFPSKISSTEHTFIKQFVYLRYNLILDNWFVFTFLLLFSVCEESFKKCYKFVDNDRTNHTALEAMDNCKLAQDSSSKLVRIRNKKEEDFLKQFIISNLRRFHSYYNISDLGYSYIGKKWRKKLSFDALIFEDFLVNSLHYLVS